MTILGEGQWTPAPWINVIANPRFGFQVSVEGGGFTWSVNSRENQLTPGPTIRSAIARARRSTCATRTRGELWSPTALPIREDDGALRRAPRPGLQPLRAHLARHRARAAAVRAARRPGQDLAPDDPRTSPDAPRRLSVTAYVEWVLGASRERRGAVRRHRDRRGDRRDASRAIPGTPSSARASRSPTSAGRQTRVDRRPHGVPRPQRHARPARRACAATDRSPDRVGAGLDPCGALQTPLELAADGRAEIVVLPRRGGDASRGARACSSATARADLDAVLGAVDAALGRRARRGSGEDAGPLAWTSC